MATCAGIVVVAVAAAACCLERSQAGAAAGGWVADNAQAAGIAALAEDVACNGRLGRPAAFVAKCPAA